MRTRFAPSPTGYLHLGGARTAILNWLVARHHGGGFVLRVEDTDAERNVPGAEAELLDDLRWLGLDWDEGPDVGGTYGPYRQSERGGIYREHAERLVEAAAAYHDAGAVRFRVPRVDEITVDDLVRGRVVFPADSVEDFVLLRSDGRPTYNFAAAVDDAAMRITHVIRGADHLVNTPKQLLLYRALGWDTPRFAHIPLILGPDRQKLSKRHGATSVAEHRRIGYLSEALVNYLSLLSWSSPSGDEVLPRERLVREVDLGRVGASDAVFDREKLRWLSHRYLQDLPLDELVELARPFIDPERFPLPPARLPAVLAVVRDRLSVLSEVNDHLAPFLGPRTEEQVRARRAALADPEARRVLDEARACLQALPVWEEQPINAAVREAGRSAGAKGRALFSPLRLALTGEEHGPELAKVVYALGRERALALLAGGDPGV